MGQASSTVAAYISPRGTEMSQHRLSEHHEHNIHTTFLDLPPVVRRQIYDLALPAGGPDECLFPPLLATCRVVRDEGSMLYYGRKRYARVDTSVEDSGLAASANVVPEQEIDTTIDALACEGTPGQQTAMELEERATQDTQQQRSQHDNEASAPDPNAWKQYHKKRSIRPSRTYVANHAGRRRRPHNRGLLVQQVNRKHQQFWEEEDRKLYQALCDENPGVARELYPEGIGECEGKE